ALPSTAPKGPTRVSSGREAGGIGLLVRFLFGELDQPVRRHELVPAPSVLVGREVNEGPVAANDSNGELVALLDWRHGHPPPLEPVVAVDHGVAHLHAGHSFASGRFRITRPRSSSGFGCGVGGSVHPLARYSTTSAA